MQSQFHASDASARNKIVTIAHLPTRVGRDGLLRNFDNIGEELRLMKIRFAVSRLTLALSVAFFLVAGVAFAASRGWVIFASPNAGQTNLLASVTAVAASDAWAVGYAYAADSQELTITQHWDGTSWSAIQSPNPGTAEECGNAVYGGNELWSVDAISSNDVWAVGNLCGPGTARTLTMHWDGTGWAVIPSPNKSSLDDSELSSVSAVSSNDVWAVGNYQVAFQYQWETLIEHWNGTAWSIVPSPNPSDSEITYLKGVSAVSATDVWAVGYSQGGAKPLIEHWDGTAWNIVPAPYPSGSDFNGLYAVAAISANDVWAVGYQNTNDQGKNGQGLIVHWDGTQWSAVNSPIAGNATILLGVTANSSKDVTAVGYIQTSTIQFLPVTEHWNGTKWTVLRTPSPGPVAQLYGAAAKGSTWAVGAYSTQPMTQGYMVNPLTLIIKNR